MKKVFLFLMLQFTMAALRFQCAEEQQVIIDALQLQVAALEELINR